MTPAQLDRLRALEHEAEAAALLVAALRQNITALVSEAEHGEVEARSEAGTTPAPLQFYGQAVPETPDHAIARPSRARRSP